MTEQRVEKPRISVTYLVKLDLTTEELNIMRDALASHLSRVTDRATGGSDNHPHVETLKWFLEVLK